MSEKNKLKKNLENFIDIFGLEKEKEGDVVKRNNEIFYHFLGADYNEEDQIENGLEKSVHYFSSHDIPKKSDDINSPLNYAEYGYDLKIAIFKKSNK